MRFNEPLGVGAKGGHGPIRYFVEEFDPGSQIIFRFTGPAGFHGTHRFRVVPLEGDSELRHTIEMQVTGSALLTWPLVFRPLHDALLEDCLDKVEADLSGRVWGKRAWSLHVRILRKLLAGKGKKTS